MLKKNDTKLEKKEALISLTPIQLVFQMAWIIYNKKNSYLYNLKYHFISLALQRDALMFLLV
jgi:hypothetical protein